MSENPAEYGDACAPFYDLLYPTVEPGLISCLNALAAEGPALELGLATGRVAIALALARSGVEVHGIEASAAMLERFLSRDDSSGVRAIHGDFVTDIRETGYQLIFSLVSTFYLLPSLARQKSCLESIAVHLQPGGVFLNEAYVSSPDTIPVSREHSLRLAGKDQLYRVTTLSTPLTTLDALATAAGLELTARWSNWRRSPYRSGMRHISLYALAAGANA